ncbi:MAG: DUF928 domain-containing protein [Nostoc sp. DedQUE05]|uniref:DUF928 domain-containing protein n=1 Tax=Nostoc sp. DedQUE05 TaxID=3075391 RepID=UPI002AD2DE0B|nr:DUF928 domain-containing protein [Nostoc sp. DedQUE05]MDZ8091590.1 DUF928 domain-containing protein [Nostoc sp. DedQUE05]
MSQIKFTPRIAILCLVAVIIISSALPLLITPNVIASEELNLIERLKYFFLGKRPSKVATGRQRGGARRDRCPNVPDPLTALVPFDVDGVPFVEQTISDRPTFWFYIPYLPVSRRNAEFVLIDENEDDVYSATFSLSQKEGIASLQLPLTVPPLKQGKKYQWVFSVICNPINRSGDATVNGWVERVPESSTLNSRLKVATTREKISIYTEAGLWYETLTSFTILLKNNPQDEDLKKNWLNLQQTLGITRISSEDWILYSLPEPTKNLHKNPL